ncbi:LacI family DNA-binding transcriptional regulator [Brachybacterium sp. J153]|uniref:LacI family DNA-binding transcriptional regulator n=1 Tax=Brachybacterium sp. J153 TaxID=3116488 RepID=UPI002E7A662B|nr:LacI family DNA-binding transcriptional regulator [Brachybacterium sp. J153]MEE1617685.1 LacI family DNA-binding transcriptional regulator [Brachybacterium sp. J153]
MQNARRPTIRDVARLAGVSHQTVSRHLKHDPTVSPMLAAHIDQAVAQLDYRPNLVARAMRNRSTGRLALVLPAGDGRSPTEVLAGANDAAQEAGLALEVVTLPSGELEGGRVAELADSGLYEAVLSLTDLPGGGRERLGTVPIISAPVFDRRLRGVGPLSEANRMTELVQGLADLGHRELLHLTGDRGHPSSQRRREAYLHAVDDLGLRSAGVIDCGWDPEVARRTILELPADTATTAVLAADDVVAAGVIRGARERGWRIPEDLSVTGWDDLPLGAWMSPSLTTVSIDNHRLGAELLEELLRVMRGEDPAMNRPTITRLVWRESTGPAPAR